MQDGREADRRQGGRREGGGKEGREVAGMKAGRQRGRQASREAGRGSRVGVRIPNDIERIRQPLKFCSGHGRTCDSPIFLI